MALRRVMGDSMAPTLRAGQIVIVRRFLYKPKVGHVVMVRHNGLDKVKRITDIKADRVFVVGDNPSASTDSRHFGWVPKTRIIGKIVSK